MESCAHPYRLKQNSAKNLKTTAEFSTEFYRILYHIQREFPTEFCNIQAEFPTEFCNIYNNMESYVVIHVESNKILLRI